MTYTYADMPDKTAKGILDEVSKGLAIAAFYFETSMGIPFEIFNGWIEDITDNNGKLLWYMNFRNQHPTLFNGKE